MRELVIDRTRWHRGRGHGNSYLLNSEDKMCCLGFECIANGYTPDQIKKVSTPRCLVIDIKSTSIPDNLRWLVRDREGVESSLAFVSTDDAKLLMDINDDMDIYDEERQQQISAIFARNSIQVTFIN